VSPQGTPVYYRDIYELFEIDHSYYNFKHATVDRLIRLFNEYEAESQVCLDHQRVFPAFEYCLKCSHTFNLLDARGAISVTERMSYILRIRELAFQCANGYVQKGDVNAPGLV
jgi:glycyl-tRNA synthetase alpha subunit